MRLALTPDEYEHFRRALTLVYGMRDVLAKEHPNDWKERVSGEMASELETAKATLDDYIESFNNVYNSLV